MVSVKDLEQLGLSKNTARVYLALCDLGQVKAAAIITATGLHRNLVYLALKNLIKKKLIITTSVRGVAQFKILNPERLLQEIKLKEVVALQVIEELKVQHKQQAQEIIVYEGIEEIRRKELESYQQMQTGETMYYLGTSSHWYEIMGIPLIRKMVTIQQKNRFTIRIIQSFKTPESDFFYAGLDDSKLFQIKLIPNISSEVSEMQILPDRIMLKTFEPPYAVVEIINPLIAKSYREYFEYLWQHADSTVLPLVTTPKF